MTLNRAGRKTVADRPRVTLDHLVKKYRTQTRAAEAWGVSQPAISRLLSGERGNRDSEVLRAIAEVEGIEADDIVLQGARRLHAIDGGISDGSARFVYDIQDPHRMLKQLQSWFADLPRETRMRRQVVRAVMRVLFDESFDTVHVPSRQWRTVMQNMYELSLADTRRAQGGD